MRYHVAFTERWNATPFWGVDADVPITKPAIGELVDLRARSRDLMAVTGVMTGYGKDKQGNDTCYTLVLVAKKQFAATEDNPVPWPW